MNGNDTGARTIEISTRTILKILVILLLLAFLWFVRDIVLLVLVALILASAIDAPVDWLHRRGVPRSISVLFIYLLLVSVITAAFALVIPPIAEQVRNLAANLPDLFARVNTFLQRQNVDTSSGALLDSIQRVLNTFSSTLTPSSATTGVFGTLSHLFGSVFQVALVLVLTFYLVVQENGLKRFFRAVVPAKHAPYVTQLMNRMQGKIGQWLRAQLLLALIVGVLFYVILALLGMPYALVLAILAGVLEIVPYIGPILTAIPAVFLAIPSGWGMVLAVGIGFLVVQQIENHVLTPKIMQKAVGLNPVVVILALLIGAKVAGFAGLLLAVPLTTAIAEFTRDFFGTSAEEATDEESWLLKQWDKFKERVRHDREVELHGKRPRKDS